MGMNFTPDYLDVLAAQTNTSHTIKTGETALKNMAHHMKRMASFPGDTSDYADAGKLLSFAAQIRAMLNARIDNSWGFECPNQRTMVATIVYYSIKSNRHTLIPASSKGHAMLMEFIKDENNNSYTIKIYNSGNGLEFHPKLGIKHQTVIQYSGAKLGSGPRTINVESLTALFAIRSEKIVNSPSAVYGWAVQKAPLQENPPGTPWQKEQKSLDCTNECIMAYLRNNLSYADYKFAKGLLMSMAADATRRLDAEWSKGVRENLNAKAKSADARLFAGERPYLPPKPQKPIRSGTTYPSKDLDSPGVRI